MARNYVQEMDRLLARLINDRDSFVLREIANEALTWCQENDPELLEGWLALQAEDMLWHMLTKRQAGERAKATRVNNHAVFQGALESAEQGGDKRAAKSYLSMLDARYACNPQHEHKKYGLMTREEVNYVANTYARLENRSKLRRMFHEAVAAGLGEGETVGDKFTPARLLGIQRELGIDD